MMLYLAAGRRADFRHRLMPVVYESILGSAVRNLTFSHRLPRRSPDRAAGFEVPSCGSDVLDGGAGNDLFDGGEGINLVRFGGSSAVAVDLVAGTATRGSETDTLSSIRGAIGSSASDRFAGDGGPNWFQGRGNQDIFTGGAGRDVYAGNAQRARHRPVGGAAVVLEA
jgi:hypothetical protein